MNSVVANNNQTPFDLSLQELGSIEGLFDLIDANPDLLLDMSVPAGIRVVIPGIVLNARVVDYYSRNGINPVSGLEEEEIITQNDFNYMTQDINYDLAGGDKEFARVWLNSLHDRLTVQIVYEGITADTVVASVDQSLDGSNWCTIPYVFQTLDKTKPAHTFNIFGLETDFVRLHIAVPDESEGTIVSVSWKT